MDTLNFAYKDCDYFSFILVLNKKPPDFRENPGVEFNVENGKTKDKSFLDA